MKLSTGIIAVTYARTAQGSDEAPLLAAWRETGVSITNFDEQSYVLPNWSGALRFIRRAVRNAAVRQMESDMIRAILRLRPQLFFAFKGSFVSLEVLGAAKAVGAKCALYYPDISFLSPGERFVANLKNYDVVFSSKSFGPAELKSVSPDTTCFYVPLWYDVASGSIWNGSLEFPAPDILFVGHYSPKKAEYLRALALELRDEYKILIVGEGWAGKGLDQYWYGGGLYGGVIPILYQRATITLGLLSEKPVGGISDDQITNRTFTVPGAGGFLLHERTKDFQALFSDYAAVFDDKVDLVKKCRYYLANSQERVAMKANMFEALRVLGRDSESAGKELLSRMGFS
jgi:spore maturation protein CgeB